MLNVSAFLENVKRKQKKKADANDHDKSDRVI